MTAKDACEAIARNKPPVIYVSGKTSTGKSTFARNLREELGYHVIELEDVLLEIVNSHNLDEQLTFRKVLHDSGEFEEKKHFFEATDDLINEVLDNNDPTVIEGAVANTETLQRILKPAGNPYFLYFHPSDIDVYIRQLTERFMQSGKDSYGGLPLKFWQLVDDEEFSVFCESRELTDSLKSSIEQYARISQDESTKRLSEFRQVFKDIMVVEVR